MRFRNILKILLSAHLVISPIVRAEEHEVFDFEGDVPDYIYSGESRGDGNENGNCTGAGCDELSPEDRGEEEWYDSPDHDDSGQYDADGTDSVNSKDSDHGDDRPFDFNNETVEVRQITTFDKNRGDGVIFVRDEKGKVYYRGSPSELIKDEQGDYYSTDHTDIYYGDKDQRYVKSEDGQLLININKLLFCAPSFDCERHGFREDWWNYSITPELDTADEASEWYDLEQFEIKQFQIKNGIDKAWADSNISRSVEKASVLNAAEFLHDEARIAYQNRRPDEALALQDGALHLTSTLVDIGLGISPLGWAKDSYELISGKSIVNGQALTDTERLLSGLGVIAPAAGPLGIAGVRILSQSIKSGKNIKAFGILSKISKIVGKIFSKVPAMSSRYVKKLPPLSGTIKEAFEGPIREVIQKPGTVLFQAQRTGATTPGRWFTAVQPQNAAHAEEMLNINKWGNDAGQVKGFVVKEHVSGYSGKVAGGTGEQFYVPPEVPVSEVFEEIPL